MERKNKKLPAGLFYTPNSRWLYFKIKKLDDKTGKFVWSSPQSSKTEDIMAALRIKNEAQLLSDQIGKTKGDRQACYEFATSLVNRILQWHGLPALASETWSTFRDQFLESERQLAMAKRETRPGIDPLAGLVNTKSRVRQFDQWLAGKDPVLSSFSRQDAQAFYGWGLEQGYRPSTIGATVKIVKRIFQIAVDDGKITKNPWINLKVAGNQYRQNDPFTMLDIAAIWAGLDRLEYAEEWKTACLFGIVMGARIKDCSLRTWDELRLHSTTPHLIFKPGKTLAKDKAVKMPLVDPILSHLRGLKAVDDYLTPNLASQSPSRLSNTFSDLLRDIGIPMRVEAGVATWYSKGFHSWRHTIPTLLAANGVSDEIRMQITGHSDKALHHQYTHHDDLKLRGHLEKALSDLPKLSA